VDESGLVADADPALIQGDMQTIQNIIGTMWVWYGVQNESRGHSGAAHLWNEIETFYRTTKLDDGLMACAMPWKLR